jgi:ABC-2 type transport system permease protein
VYSALFVALSVVSRRPVLVGLVYVLVWEGVLSSFISGTGVLSVRQYVQRLALKFTGTSDFGSTVSLRTAIIMTVALTVLACYYAANRLRSFSIAGETN